jgi:hypothetical protein
MTRIALLVLFAPPCLAISGQCNNILPDNNCTGDPVASVVLTITNNQGTTLPRADIVFRLNNTSTRYTNTCDGNCNSVVLAYDLTGRFDIEVSAPGYVTATRTVNVIADSGGCHPVTQTLIVVMESDTTVGALAGAWYTQNAYNTAALRFGTHGEIIGAIIYNATIAGDGNFYIAFNSRQIKGVSGQQIYTDTAADPTRVGDVFNFSATPLSYPVGFENGMMSADYMTLTGGLKGVTATYVRLDTIPAALQSP